MPTSVLKSKQNEISNAEKLDFQNLETQDVKAYRESEN